MKIAIDGPAGAGKSTIILAGSVDSSETTESANEFNILSSSCAKQSKRSYEDSK